MPDQVRSGLPLPNRWRILPLVLLAPLMGSLDGSIVNVALPTIAKKLGVGLAGSQWVVSSYLIAISAFILAFGKVADLIGKTRVFLAGFAAFGLGSLLCALSWSLPVLIASRALQAIGAAMFMSSNQGIVASIFPPQERGRALGLMGTTVAVGTMIGPPLGGIMVELFGWQSLFLINIPIAAFAFIAGYRKLPREEPSGSLSGFDLLGSGLFALFVVGLFYFLLSGQSALPSASARLPSLGLAIACFACFLVREGRARRPMIDLSIFRSGLFSVSVLCVLLVFSATFCVNIVQPFYLQEALGLSPSAAGLVLLAAPLASGLAAPFSGYLADRFGAERLTVVGLSIVAVALALMSFLGADSGLGLAVASLAIFGLGQGVFGSPNTKLIMAHAPQDKLGIAGSINALARNMGMVSGIALSVSVLYGVMSGMLGRRVSAFVPERPDAFVAGMHAAFWAASALILVTILLTSLRSLASRRAALERKLP